MTDLRNLLLAAIAPLPLILLTPARAVGAGAVIWAPAEGRQGSIVQSAVGGTRVTGTVTRRLPTTGDPVSMASALSRTRGVAWAEPERRMVALQAADPLRRSQWSLDAIHVETGWRFARIGTLPAISGVPIAIVDTGIDSNHEEMAGRIRACAAASAGRVREGECGDRDGHGSHVAGIAAAASGNGLGIAGVAPTSPVISCRALSSRGSGTTADVAACIAWSARQGAKVINLSLGGPDSAVLHAAVKSAAAAGSVIVAAAGNGGGSDPTWPADYPEVISVAAIGQDGKRADYSNFNRDVEIAAPGSSIISLKARGGYVRLSGTSMAAPAVSGAAALLWRGLPHPTAASVRSVLDRAVRDAGPAGRDRWYGFGVLDLAMLG